MISRHVAFSQVSPIAEVDTTILHTHEEGHRLDPPLEWDWRTEHPHGLTPIQCSFNNSVGAAVCGTLADRWSLWNDTVVSNLQYAEVRGNLVEAWAFLQNRGVQPAGEDEKGFRSRKVYGVQQDERNIRTEMYMHGPVTTTFKAGEKFLRYWSELPKKPAVFECDDDNGEGEMHTVRVVGWGEWNEEPMWIVANCWGADDFSDKWGENGYFMVKRGDGSSFEQNIVVGFPFVSKKKLQPKCCDRDAEISHVEVSFYTAEFLDSLHEGLEPLPLLKCKKQKKPKKDPKKEAVQETKLEEPQKPKPAQVFQQQLREFVGTDTTSVVLLSVLCFVTFTAFVYWCVIKHNSRRRRV